MFGPADEFEVRELFENFWPPLAAMKTAASNFLEKTHDLTRMLFTDAHKTFVDACQSMNSRFIALCLTRYQSLIEK